MPAAFDGSNGDDDAWEQLTDEVYEELGMGASAFMLLDMTRNGSPAVYASSSMLDLFGCDSGDILGQPWTAMCGEATDVDDRRALEAAVYNTEECSRCLICPTKGGEIFWNHVYLEPGSRNGVQYTCLSCHDVTHLVEARGEAGTNVDVVEEASRIQALQMSTVKTVLSILQGFQRNLERRESAVSASEDGGEGQEEGEQLGEQEVASSMSAVKAALTSNSFEDLRRLLIETEEAIVASMEMRASFSLEIHDNGVERQVCVNQGNALHYAICRSAFSAALALIICCPELIGMECHWGEEVLERDIENEAPTRRLRSFNAVQLANRYGEFFEESNTDLSQLYFSMASIMQYFGRVSEQLAFMAQEAPRERLQAAGAQGEILLVELMQLTAYQITRDQEAEELIYPVPPPIPYPSSRHE